MCFCRELIISWKCKLILRAHCDVITSSIDFISSRTISTNAFLPNRQLLLFAMVKYEKYNSEANECVQTKNIIPYVRTYLRRVVAFGSLSHGGFAIGTPRIYCITKPNGTRRGKLYGVLHELANFHFRMDKLAWWERLLASCSYVNWQVALPKIVGVFPWKLESITGLQGKFCFVLAKSLIFERQLQMITAFPRQFPDLVLLEYVWDT